MGSEALVYKADDRSLLLPAYRRWLIEPLLPLIPRSVTPNAITHTGHLLNLVGTATLLALWPKRGWPFAFAAVLVQLYIWCDNVDGAHARRTGQCSALGELLDHGLDSLNVAYISFLSALVLSAPPMWWIAVTLLISGAASLTYWEQTKTGVFRLGMLNQIESGVLLSIFLLVVAVLGTDIVHTPLALGITVGSAMLLWTAAQIGVGMLRSITRVGRAAGVGAILPAVVLVAIGIAILAVASVGALSTVAAVTVGTAVNVFFAMRMLLVRLRRDTPRAEPLVVGGAFALAVLALWKIASPAGAPPVEPTSFVVALAACGAFGPQTLRDVREAATILERTEPRRSATAAE